MKSLPVPQGKWVTATLSCPTAPLTHSLSVPSPPQAYTRSSSPEAASALIFAHASMGAVVM